MFPLAILPAPPDVTETVVDGATAPVLHLDVPVLLERLSIALHRHDTTGSTGALFRSLASGGSSVAVRRRTQSLLGHPQVRQALEITLERGAAAELVDAIEDVLATELAGVDEDARDVELDA